MITALISLHVIGIILMLYAMWYSEWREKAQEENIIIEFSFGIIFIAIFWEPFLMWSIIKK